MSDNLPAIMFVEGTNNTYTYDQSIITDGIVNMFLWDITFEQMELKYAAMEAAFEKEREEYEWLEKMFDHFTGGLEYPDFTPTEEECERFKKEHPNCFIQIGIGHNKYGFYPIIL